MRDAEKMTVIELVEYAMSRYHAIHPQPTVAMGQLADALWTLKVDEKGSGK
jgi:hypothetical protein